MLEQFLERTEFKNYKDFFENYKINVPENFNFGYDVVDYLAKENPTAKALVWCNDNDEELVLTFADVKERTDRAAAYFRKLGIKRGDFVMLILQRRYEFWISIVALHKIGASVIPATHMLTKEDIVYRCNAANIKAIFAVDDRDVFKYVEEAKVESPSLEILVGVAPFGIDTGLSQEKLAAHPLWQDFTQGIASVTESDLQDFYSLKREEISKNNDVMLSYFTSGTTSHPKLVSHDFTYPLGHIVTASYWQKVQKGGLHLTVADTGWGKAVWGKLYGQWIAECTVFVYDYHDKFKPIDLIKQIEKYHITSFCAPPTIYRFLIQEDLSKYDFSSCVHWSTAGEPLSEEVFNKWKQQTGREILEGFGQTETTLSLFNFGDEKIKPGSLGKSAPYYNVTLLDEEGNEVQDGEIGEIVVRLDKGRFPGLFMEYFGDPEKTKQVMRDGWYHTGDNAWRDEDGFFWFTGRNDDVIKCSGYRIGTFEVESVLMQHPAVVECAVTGAPDPIRGQVVKATIVLAENYKPGSIELVKEIQKFVKDTTAPYKYPRIVDFVDSLPKTISGKIKRKDIRDK
ncbi:MAG: acetyl-CoA synthetase [Spirochaetaceae bacterium]|nr:acetyl-CoA synthetase [Spirochaetaceae bacterium]